MPRCSGRCGRAVSRAVSPSSCNSCGPIRSSSPATQTICSKYQAYAAKKVDGKLKDYFDLLPRKRFTIIPVPEALAPFYTSGRGGLESCQMNTYDLPAGHSTTSPLLTLHECTPGHSFQAAIASEARRSPALPPQHLFLGVR